VRRLAALSAIALICGGLACAAQAHATPDAATELKAGSDLTRQGLLREAIPHLLSARRGGADEYASSVNLAICYVGTGSYQDAAAILDGLRSAGHNTATVNNLRMQAYLGEGLAPQAIQAFEQAASQSPKDEKLYDYAADACNDHRDYELGLRMVGRGLAELPDSARLHYERAMFLAELDRLAEAKPEFARAAALAPRSYIGYLARIQDALYDDRYPEAIRLLRQGIQIGDGDSRLLSLLGAVLLRQGAAPGTPEFAEAQAALEKSAAARPDDSATQIALGKLYLAGGRPADAVDHLEIGRRRQPDNPEVYANLAHAYLRLGRRDKARECQRELLRLSAEKQR